MKPLKSRKNRRHRRTSSKKVKVSRPARLPYGGGYKGLALTICEGNADLAREVFGA